MSALTIYEELGAQPVSTVTDLESIVRELQGIGVRFERWAADRELDELTTQDEVIDAYNEQVDRLMQEYGFETVDVVSVRPDHPDRESLRKKFLDEHTHADYEVRFFVDGQGLFYLRAGDRVYAVLCEKGDLISVPANTRHWFDMGEHPSFKCIRLFTTPDGWVADFTGSDIARQLPDFDQFVANYG
ncbi:MAG: acireductone dioxygenase [Gammaproteobacteria bacterium]